MPDKRNHHLRLYHHAFLETANDRPEYSLRLRVVDIREQDPQPAAALPEHRVRLLQRLHLAQDGFLFLETLPNRSETIRTVQTDLLLQFRNPFAQFIRVR